MIVHLVAEDIARGAQLFARELADRLDSADERHLVLAIFRGEQGGLRPDADLDVPSGRLRSVGVHPLALLRVRRALRDLRPEVVVAHGGEPLKYAVVASPGRARLVYHRIGTAAEAVARGGWRRALHSRLAARADLVAAVSADAMAEARDLLGVAPDRLRLVPNGRDPAAYVPNAAARGALRPTLTFVGRLTGSKRPHRFVDLVEAVRGAGMDVDAVVAGDGPLLDEVRHRGDAVGVRVLGRCDDVPRLLAESSVFVFTSVAEGEGLPGVLVEAGMAALPVVATDVPGAREVVVDGETGYVTPVDDADMMRERVIALCADPALRARLGDAARARCTEHFGMEASVEAWRSVLGELRGP